jgi:hypothetical protein
MRLLLSVIMPETVPQAVARVARRSDAWAALLPVQRPAPGVGNLHPFDPNQPLPRSHAPPLCGREAAANQIVKRSDCEATRHHDGFGASERRAGDIGPEVTGVIVHEYQVKGLFRVVWTGM